MTSQSFASVVPGSGNQFTPDLAYLLEARSGRGLVGALGKEEEEEGRQTVRDGVPPRKLCRNTRSCG